MIRSLFLALALLCLINCQTQKTTDSNSSNTSTNQESDQKNTDLELGKPIKIAKTNITAKYLRIIEDSRCPEGVTCVWQGLAIVEIEVKTPTSKPQIIQLSTMEFQGKNAKQTENIFGYNITLENVLPGKSTDQNAKNAKNHITVSVQKAD